MEKSRQNLFYKEDITMPYIGFTMHETDHRKIIYPQSAPKWVLETNFGRTQFCIFYWLRVMARFPERLSFAYENLCDPVHYEMTQSLVKELKQAKKKRRG